MKKLQVKTVWSDGFKNDYEIINPRKGKVNTEAAHLNNLKQLTDWKILKGRKVIVEKTTYSVNTDYS